MKQVVHDRTEGEVARGRAGLASRFSFYLSRLELCLPSNHVGGCRKTRLVTHELEDHGDGVEDSDHLRGVLELLSDLRDPETLEERTGPAGDPVELDGSNQGVELLGLLVLEGNSVFDHLIGIPLRQVNAPAMSESKSMT